MLKMVFNLIKKFILAVLLIYAYNKMTLPMNLFIPKKIFMLLKQIIIAIFLLYAFNNMAVSLNLFIPMNIFTILLVTICGIPSIIMLVMYLVMFM